MAASHREAILAALRADPNLTVYEAPVGKGIGPPYVAVYVYIPNEDRSKMNGPTDETTITTITKSTPASMQGVAIIAARVRAALLDQSLPVDGFSNSRITHESAPPPEWDDSTGVALMVQSDDWDYTARLA